MPRLVLLPLHSTRIIDTRRDDVTVNCNGSGPRQRVRLTTRSRCRRARRWAAQILCIAGKLIVTVVCFGTCCVQVSASDTLRAALGLKAMLDRARRPDRHERNCRFWHCGCGNRALIDPAAVAPDIYLPRMRWIAIYWLFDRCCRASAGEGIRAWKLTRFGYSWRTGLTGVKLESTAQAASFCVPSLSSFCCCRRH